MTTPKTFEQTALPHLSVLHDYALYLTKNRENANDLLQDTYLTAYRFWSHFEIGTNIRGWLYRIMKNSFINRRRKGKREPTGICYEEHHLPYYRPEDGSVTRDELQEEPYTEVFGDEIVCSIGSIKDKYRNAVLLGDIEGFSYEEIAQTLGCPIGTVRSRLHRGRKLLKEKLFTYARDNGYIAGLAGVKTRSN